MSTPAEYFAGSELGQAAFDRVVALLEPIGDVEVRTTRSQVAFRRRRGFASLWRPGQYLHSPAAEVVLSVALGRQDPSPRWKEVVHPSARHWMHHLELHAVTDLDDEVATWLHEAATRAG
jgi:hypothetical protein